MLFTFSLFTDSYICSGRDFKPDCPSCILSWLETVTWKSRLGPFSSYIVSSTIKGLFKISRNTLIWTSGAVENVSVHFLLRLTDWQISQNLSVTFLLSRNSLSTEFHINTLKIQTKIDVGRWKNLIFSSKVIWWCY